MYFHIRRGGEFFEVTVFTISRLDDSNDMLFLVQYVLCLCKGGTDIIACIALQSSGHFSYLYFKSSFAHTVSRHRVTVRIKVLRFQIIKVNSEVFNVGTLKT